MSLQLTIKSTSFIKRLVLFLIYIYNKTVEKVRINKKGRNEK